MTDNSRQGAADAPAVMAAARALGWSLTEAEARAIADAAEGVEESYSALWKLADDDPAPAIGRAPGRAPEDPSSGWAWRCDISLDVPGPLHGVRIAVKDSIAVAGMPATVGSLVVTEHVSTADAECVRRLLTAGGHIVGKSTTEDLCIGGASCTSKPYPLANPVDPGRSVGGSSSGSALLLARGECDLALGADQGGSIRIPAALCGVVGLKPTFGLVPFTGVLGLVGRLDHVGPMARTVREVAVALDVLAGPDGVDPRQAHPEPPRAVESLERSLRGLRIGVLIEGFAATRAGEAEHPGSAAAADVVERAARALAEHGCSVVDVSIPWHDAARHIYTPMLLEAGAANIWLAHGASIESLTSTAATPVRDIVAGLKRAPDLASLPTKLLGTLGTLYLDRSRGAALDRANTLLPALRRAYDEALRDVDVLICPTTAPAGIAGLASGDPLESIGESLAYFHNTCVTNMTGHPAVSVPVGAVDGLPVGAMVTAAHGQDGLALLVAHHLELSR